MEIKVNAHTIQLTQNEIVNEGEYNIQQCNFTFSEEYNGLTKIAIFSNLNNSFQTMITNGSCIIPAEILQQEGALILGVYGYEADGDNLIKRYSPTPACFTVSKGSYQLASEVEPPSPSIVEQLEEQINELSDEITTINNIIPTLALKSEITTKTSQLTNDSGFIDKNVNDLTNYTKTNDLSAVATSGDYDDLLNKPTIPVVPTNVSAFNNDVGYVTKNVNDMTYYTLKTSTGSLIDLEINSTNYVITLSLKDIDGNVISTDTIDLPLESVVVGGSYDSTNKKIVLTLENGNTVDIPVGDLVAGLQTELSSSNKLNADYIDDSNSGKKLVTTTQINTWNAKLDSSALTNYVKNTDYANSSRAGIVQSSNTYGFLTTNAGLPYAIDRTYTQYQNANSLLFISKTTLENVITGKGLTTKSYVDGLVGNIDTILETLTVGNGV